MLTKTRKRKALDDIITIFSQCDQRVWSKPLQQKITLLEKKTDLTKNWESHLGCFFNINAQFCSFYLKHSFKKVCPLKNLKKSLWRIYSANLQYLRVFYDFVSISSCLEELL